LQLSWRCTIRRELLQHELGSINDANGTVTAALEALHMNSSNRSDDDPRGGWSGSGGSGRSVGSGGTVRYLGDEGVEDPLLSSPPV